MKNSIRLLLIATGFMATTCSSPLSAIERQGTTLIPEFNQSVEIQTGETQSGKLSAKARETKEETSSAAYFRRLDADCNRRISLSEYTDRRPGKKVSEALLTSLFDSMDLDKNGYLTPAEFARARSVVA